MATSDNPDCTWRSWRTVAEWSDDVRPDQKVPVVAFLNRVQAGIARLEDAFGEDSTNGDLIALLTPELLRLAGVTDPTRQSRARHRPEPLGRGRPPRSK